MPHITIEYSANVADHHDIDALVEVVHQAALDHGLASLDALRTRAADREHYRIADGQPDHAFIALAARIGPGRDLEARTSFLEQVLFAAVHRIESADSPLAIAWSAELTEIDPETRINRNRVRARLQAQGVAALHDTGEIAP